MRSLSTALWSLTHLTALHISDNSLSRIPPDIAKLHNLVYLDLSSNKIRSLPAELGNMVSLRSVTTGVSLGQSCGMIFLCVRVLFCLFFFAQNAFFPVKVINFGLVTHQKEKSGLKPKIQHALGQKLKINSKTTNVLKFYFV